MIRRMICIREGEGVNWIRDGGQSAVIEESGGGVGERAKKTIASVGAAQIPTGDVEAEPDAEVNDDDE